MKHEKGKTSLCHFVTYTTGKVFQTIAHCFVESILKSGVLIVRENGVQNVEVSRRVVGRKGLCLRGRVCGLKRS